MRIDGRRQAATLLLLGLVVAITISCGGLAGSASNSGISPTNSSSPSPGVTQAAAPAQPGPVVIVLEENHSYEQVIGSAAMPYFNGLAQQGALATQYYANVHPSIGNYFELTVGATETSDNNWPGPVTDDNLARELAAAGKTWKTYAEDLPSPGYLGGDVGAYIKHHDPFAYLSDVINNADRVANLVQFSQFAADLSAGTLPAFSFVVPNALDDAHECPVGVTCSDADRLTRADQWLKTNIAPLLASPQFEKGGLLIVVFDESDTADIRGGGGRVALIAVGPKARAGAQSSVSYAHQNTLKTICAALGLASCPGAAASANAMDDLVAR